MKTLILSLALTLSFSTHAGISADLKADLPQSPYALGVEDFQYLYESPGIKVVGVEAYMDMYSKPVFIEIETDDTREMYIVNDSNEDQRNNRNTKVGFISNLNSSDWQHGHTQNFGADALYVGQTVTGKSRYIILSPGIGNNTYIAIYVKVNGVQYSTRIRVFKK